MSDFVLAEDIAARIEELQAHLGLTQDELGERFGRNGKAVGTWQRGEVTPPIGVLLKAARREGWPPEIFAEGGPRPAMRVNRPVNAPNQHGGPRSPTTLPLRGTVAPGVVREGDYFAAARRDAGGRVRALAGTILLTRLPVGEPVSYEDVVRYFSLMAEAAEGGPVTLPPEAETAAPDDPPGEPRAASSKE